MAGCDFCPRCNAYARPMVWLGKGKGCICEDCYEKEVKDSERDSGGNYCDNLRNNSGAQLDEQQ